MGLFRHVRHVGPDMLAPPQSHEIDIQPDFFLISSSLMSSLSPSSVLPPPEACSLTLSMPQTPPRYVLVQPAAATIHLAHQVFDQMSE